MLPGVPAEGCSQSGGQLTFQVLDVLLSHSGPLNPEAGTQRVLVSAVVDHTLINKSLKQRYSGFWLQDFQNISFSLMFNPAAPGGRREEPEETFTNFKASQA